MLRSDPTPFYFDAQSGRHGPRMARVRARRMNFVIVMLAAIAVAPFLVLAAGSIAF